VVGKTLSPERNLSVGVPQGSVLSSLLFLLYISDIGEWIESATITGYADDTSLTMSSQDMTSLLRNLETEANNVLQYMAVNKLVANPGKTKFLLIREIYGHIGHRHAYALIHTRSPASSPTHSPTCSPARSHTHPHTHLHAHLHTK
jgi:hypothetical protein